MNDYKELIYALKCSATVHTKCEEDCPYRVMEEIKPDFPLLADVIIDGVGYWISCDCDRMAIDAANAIEQLVKERDRATLVGEWQEATLDRSMGKIKGYMCSKCGYEKIGRISKPNYCAECGAKMFGGER